MPSISAFVWASLPVLLAALIYQVGIPAVLTDNVPWKLFPNLFLTTHCYKSVKTLSERLPTAHCFTANDGIFSSVFVDETSDDEVREARTGYVYPGFWDGHGHLIQFGESLDSVDIFGANSMDESDLEISKDFKDLYVMLDRVDVHCIWVSEKVLSLLPSLLPDVPGGEIPAKGIFCDNAMDIVMELYPKPNSARKTAFIKAGMTELNKYGIVGMHDAGVTPGDLKLYKELASDDDWTVRVNAMIECDVRNTFCPEAVEKISTANGKFQVKSVKLFGDGALGSWGSAMIEPYSDKPLSSGSLLVNATMLSQVTHDWAQLGYQVNIHAIGDLANRLAIDAFENALKSLCPDITPRECQAKYRFRIEHSQIIHPDDQVRMFELGIIPSIQPTHATSDMGYAESRLGPERTKHEAYRMRSLLPLHPVLGSDFPVEPASIFEGMYAAITRRSPHTGLDPNGGKTGWYPEETLTFSQALEGFTVNPAYGAFLEDQAGVIEVGTYADWVVVDEELELLDVEALRKVTVRETWVGGKMVYQRPT
ncbi:Amidohydrolase [Pyrenophora tritici-repentis]|uniref:Amidohydrolase n=1 Tax=Pyrenophora tritici-repentis TaxID=45151 RepID=A0A317ABQ1_9PLEO|nr:Amidohydrolase [Pyrenophora tritici-repentis]